MAECTFCGKLITPGTGKMYVKKDGTVFHFCSSKCQNAQVDRGFKARITPWTNLFNQIKAKNKK